MKNNLIQITKLVTIIVACLLPVCALNADTQKELPPEAARLKEAYLSALKKETERLRTEYLQALGKLETTAVRSAKVDEAIAIREEIVRTKAEISPATTKGLSEEFLCSRSWVLSVPAAGWTETWTFSKGGTMSGSRRHSGVWRLSGGILRMDLRTREWSEFSTQLQLEGASVYLSEIRSHAGKRKDTRLTADK